MPWYWILIIVSAIVGPFEALCVLNKLWKKKEREKKEKEQD